MNSEVWNKKIYSVKLSKVNKFLIDIVREHSGRRFHFIFKDLGFKRIHYNPNLTKTQKLEMTNEVLHKYIMDNYVDTN